MRHLRNFIKIFWVFLRLGLTSFGGPVAHLGYFHREFVEQRKWLDQQTYADLVALCQFLPGPASSQLGMAIGLMRAGLTGSIAAWMGFTLPSAVMLTVFAFGLSSFDDPWTGGWVHGLKIVTVAVVAQAVFVMGRGLCPDIERKIIAFFAALFVLWMPSFYGQAAVMILGALVGITVLKPTKESTRSSFFMGISKRTGMFFLSMFFFLVVSLPVASSISGQYAVKLFDSFYRAGSLVFGGGHVVLPLLKSQVVTQGWVSNDTFLAGYGMAQAVPGPLFSFAAYLGAVSSQPPSGWIGAIIALVAIFLPGYLLIAGVLPFWESLRRFPKVRQAMMGVNVSVVGILLAALYDPVFTGAVRNLLDGSAVVVGLAFLVFCRRAPWAVIILIGISAAFFNYFG